MKTTPLLLFLLPLLSLGFAQSYTDLEFSLNTEYGNNPAQVNFNTNYFLIINGYTSLETFQGWCQHAASEDKLHGYYVDCALLDASGTPVPDSVYYQPPQTWLLGCTPSGSGGNSAEWVIYPPSFDPNVKAQLTNTQKTDKSKFLGDFRFGVIPRGITLEPGNYTVRCTTEGYTLFTHPFTINSVGYPTCSNTCSVGQPLMYPDCRCPCDVSPCPDKCENGTLYQHVIACDVATGRCTYSIASPCPAGQCDSAGTACLNASSPSNPASGNQPPTNNSPGSQPPALNPSTCSSTCPAGQTQNPAPDCTCVPQSGTQPPAGTTPQKQGGLPCAPALLLLACLGICFVLPRK